MLGNFFLPMMIGAKDLAFPRLNLLSWYLYVIGGRLHPLRHARPAASTPAGPSTRPTARNRSHTNVMPRVARHLHRRLLLILTGLNFIVTIHRMRAPGLTWFRLPLFVWAHLRHQLHHPAGARRCWPSP